MHLYRYLHTKEYAQYGGLPDQRAKSVGVLAQELEIILPDAITKAVNINTRNVNFLFLKGLLTLPSIAGFLRVLRFPPVVTLDP